MNTQYGIKKINKDELIELQEPEFNLLAFILNCLSLISMFLLLSILLSTAIYLLFYSR